METPEALRARAAELEAGLRESEERLASVLAAVPVGIGVVRDRRIVSLNRQGAEMLGYAREELVGRDTGFLFESDGEYERVGRELYAFRGEGRPPEIETKYRRKDGVLLDVLIRGAYLDPEDRGKGLTYAVLDISQQKRMERALESRVLALTAPDDASGPPPAFEELFDLQEIQRIQDAFAEAAGVASIITDMRGKPLTRPSNFCKLCGELVRSKPEGAIACEESDAEIGRAVATGPTVRRCLSSGLLDGGAGICVGERHIANWLIGQVLDDEANADAVRAYAESLGAGSAEAEDAVAKVPRMPRERFDKICTALFLIARQISTLAFQNVQQARAIAERKLAEAALRESEARLKAALAEKDALYKELSHRVKNGMALMAGLVGLEAARSDDPALKDVLETTGARILSMSNLYDLLGKEGSPTEVRADAYLGRIVDSLRDSLGEAVEHIGFETDLEALTVQAKTAAPLGLVAMELLTNALKYAFPESRPGSVRLRLAAEGEDLVLTVADDGVGLPPGFSAKSDGGLGMELVGMLTAQMGGAWTIGPGPGARFDVRIPRRGA